MRISATGNNAIVAPQGERGFTLIEMMVVIVIIGLASAAVVLAMPDPRGRVRDEAERFAARALAVRDDAIAQGRSESVVVTETGYRIEQRAHGRWQDPGNPAFGAVAWRGGTIAAVGPTGQARATFDPTGGTDEPLTLDLVRDGVRTRISIPVNGTPHVAG